MEIIMQARITKAFRIREASGQRKYTAGDVATDPATADWAVEHGFGEAVAEEPAGKAKPAPQNKAKGGA